MCSLLQSTRNTRALPTGDLRYIRSDYPENLTTSEVQWLLQNNVVTSNVLLQCRKGSDGCGFSSSFEKAGLQ